MTPFELAEPATAGRGDRPARSRRPDGAADRRRHRPDADDEGRRFPPDAARQPAQARRQLSRIAAGPDGSARHRRHDAAGGGRALARGCARRAGDPARHAAAVQHPRAQRRDHRRQSRPRRPAHGPAAGADRARRQVAVAGPTGERTIAVEDLFAGYFETVLAKNELIAELRIPPQGKRRAAYLKVTTGSAEDWPALGVAVALEADGRSISRRGWSSAPRPRRRSRLKAAEKGARRRRHRRQGLCARRRCRRRGSRVHLRRARLGRLQARARSRLCRARRAPALNGNGATH